MIKDQLAADMKVALKEGNTIKKNTIQLLRAAILQEEKDQQKSFTDDEVQQIIAKEKKKRLDSLAQFEKVNRTDLIQQTQTELLYIEQYLPKQLSEQEITAVIQQIIVEENAGSKDIGKVIRKAKEQLGLQADGRTISYITNQLLKQE